MTAPKKLGDVASIVTAPPRQLLRVSVLDGAQVEAGPYFTVKQMSEFFFGKGPHWIRFAERQGYLDNVNAHRGPGQVRRYNLGDVEQIAHVMFDLDRIPEDKFRHVLVLVRAEAEVHDRFAAANGQG